LIEAGTGKCRVSLKKCISNTCLHHMIVGLFYIEIIL
jgi:hypothetical protein